MARITEIHKKWLGGAGIPEGLRTLDGEFALARAVIAARNRVGLTQAQLARKWGQRNPSLPAWRVGACVPPCEPLSAWQTLLARVCSSVLDLATPSVLRVEGEPQQELRIHDRSSIPPHGFEFSRGRGARAHAASRLPGGREGICHARLSGQELGHGQALAGTERFYVRAHPSVFVPATGAWGQQGCTLVRLKTADANVVQEAMKEAWLSRAPKY